MGLSERVKQSLNENINFDNEGLLNANVIKADTVNVPIIIIGLGGTGVDAVIRSKKLIRDRMKCGKDANTKTLDKPNNIEYMAIDTDKTNANAAYGGMHFNKDLDEFFLFQNSDVAAILRDRETTLMPQANEWLSEQLPVTKIINGAAGVRQAGRLMLFLNSVDIVSALKKKIQRVCVGHALADTPISVFILSGISGGTGSGSFIDISYMVRQLIKNMNAKAEISGMFFMPDVSASVVLDKPIQDNIRRNGFAALKELDYLMNLEKSGDYFEQGYGGGFYVTKTQESPFDLCMLISSKDESGTPFQNPYEYALNVAAETVMNFIADEKLETAGAKFGINSYISNIAGIRDSFVTGLTRKMPVNYIYNAVGASSAFLPIDGLMSYTTCMMFQEIDTMYCHDPNESDQNEAIKYFKMDFDTLKNEFYRNVPQTENLPSLTFDRIKADPSCVKLEYAAVGSRQDEFLEEAIRIKVDNIKAALEDKNNYIYTAFRDLSRGPIFAQRLIYSIDAPSMITYINEAQKLILGRIIDSQMIQSYYDDMTDTLDDLLNKGVFTPKLKARDEYMEACSLYYDALLNNEIMYAMQTAYRQIYNALIDKNHEIFDCCSELLTMMKALFYKYSNIKTGTKRTVDASGTTFSWYLIETPLLIKNMEERMKNTPELQLNFKKIVGDFYQTLVDSVDTWIGKTNEDVVDCLNNYISNSFGRVLNQTMDFFMGFKAADEGKELGVYYKELLEALDKNAKTMYPSKGALAGLVMNFPVYQTMSAPRNSAEIIKQAMDYCKNKSSADLKQSAITDRIFKANFKAALPLYSYAELDICEDTYERVASTTQGLHLYERNKNWRNLPSPNFETTWTSGHFCPREAELNHQYRDIFDRAYRYGYIIWSSDLNLYQCRFGRFIDVEAILLENNIDVNSDFNLAMDAGRCVKAMKQAMSEESRFHKLKNVYDIIFLEDGITPDIEYAKNIFIQMFTTRDEIKKMVENHEVAQMVINKLAKYDGLNKLIRIYIRCSYTGIVFKKRQEIKYLDPLDTIQSLYTFTGDEDIYQEYYIFNAFADMLEKTRNQLNDKAAQILREAADEEYDTFVKGLNEYLDGIKEKMEELRVNWQDIALGKEKLAFYEGLLMQAKAEQASM